MTVDPLGIAVVALRGFAAVIVATTLVGGIPRLAQLGLAVTIGLWSALLVGVPAEATLERAAAELVVGGALGLVAAMPVVAAMTAGRLVDLAATGRAHGSYGYLFGVLAGAVFVGIDGHVAVVTAIVDSHRAMPSLATARADVLGAVVGLVATAVRLAVPWLVTAAVVEIAAGVGLRIATRAAPGLPAAAAVPAALVMMTATLVGVLAVAMASLFRGAL